MQLLIINRTKTESAWFNQGFIDEIQKLVAPIGLDDWSAGLIIVDDEEIQTINRQFRSKDYVTDVLSFSHLVLCDIDIATIRRGKDYAADNLFLDKMETQIGEIIIAPEFVSNRCKENDWNISDELAMLVVHGALHLMGWDHEEKSQTEKMRHLESELLALTDRSHPLA
ncbi:rRNA maturation RNase YbeY [bacterium]|jgi:probable rRNA maturation factor|nr:rRNA maturation RNase YbeY [bacterium]